MFHGCLAFFVLKFKYLKNASDHHAFHYYPISDRQLFSVSDNNSQIIFSGNIFTMELIL